MISVAGKHIEDELLSVIAGPFNGAVFRQAETFPVAVPSVTEIDPVAARVSDRTVHSSLSINAIRDDAKGFSGGDRVISGV